MTFKPKFFPTLFTIPALVVLLLLGSWQMQRLNWKAGVVKKIEYKTSLPAVNLSGEISDISELVYRKIIVEGVFDHDKEMHLYTGPKIMRGKPGYDLLTPLVMDDGRAILVDRGWVPQKLKEKASRPESLVQGRVKIEAMVHKGESKAMFTPDNDQAKNFWFWIDMDGVAKHTGYNLPNFYIRSLRDGDEYPLGGDILIKHKNDHLQYAITWYSLAIILLVIYVLFHKKQQD